MFWLKNPRWEHSIVNSSKALFIPLLLCMECGQKIILATTHPSPSQQPQLKNVPFVPCRYGNVPKGCVLSYQQRMSTDYVINDFTCTAFPELPLDNSEKRFVNNCLICLDNKQQAAFEALSVTRNASLKVQEQTITDSSSSIWYLLRKKRITATKFGLVAK